MFSVHRYEAGVIRENYAESIRSRNEEQTILYVYIYTRYLEIWQPRRSHNNYLTSRINLSKIVTRTKRYINRFSNK